MVTNEVNKQKKKRKKKRERLEIFWDGSWKSLFFPAIHNFGMTKRRTNMFRLLTLHNFLPLSEKTQSNSVKKIFIHTMQVMFQANRSTYSLKCMNCSKNKSNCFLKQCYTTPSLHWRSTADKKLAVCHWEWLI